MHSRHSFATEMVRLGVSLPVLMQLLGHKNIHMTLRYVAVAQLDVQREFQRTLQNVASRHVMPQLPMTPRPVLQQVDIPAFARRLLPRTTCSNYSSPNCKTSLDRNFADYRNGSSRSTLNSITSSQNERTLAGQTELRFASFRFRLCGRVDICQGSFDKRPAGP
jgi:integrase-like protein